MNFCDEKNPDFGTSVSQHVVGGYRCQEWPVNWRVTQMHDFLQNKRFSTDRALAKEMKAKSANASVKKTRVATESVYLCGGRKNEEGLEATECSVGTDMLLITFATT